MYADEHNPTGAIVPLERAIRLDPENAEANRTLGVILGSLGLFARAEAPLRRACALYAEQSVNNESLRSELADARNSPGSVLVNLERWDEALPLFLLATEEITYGSAHLAFGNLGMVYLHRGQLPEAITALQRSVRLQASFCVGNARLGEALFRNHDAAHAVEALDRAVGTHQDGCDRLQGAYLWRAKARIELHQTDAAQEDIQRCVALGNGTPEGLECATLQRGGTP